MITAQLQTLYLSIERTKNGAAAIVHYDAGAAYNDTVKPWLCYGLLTNGPLIVGANSPPTTDCSRTIRIRVTFVKRMGVKTVIIAYVAGAACDLLSYPSRVSMTRWAAWSSSFS